MAEESLARPGDQPYFFLSYRRSEYRPDDGSDPDRWVKKLYRALCNDVHELTATSNPGFMDQQRIPAGSQWPVKLAEAIASCRVFVALLRPGYFSSEYCGKEWAAFTQRMQMQGIGNASQVAIIPALWTPFRLDEMPPELRSMQLIPPGFPQEYAQEGLFALMKLNRYSAAYKESVWLLAKMIKKAAEQTRIAVSEPVVLDSLTSPFAEHQAQNDARRIRVVIAAYSGVSSVGGFQERRLQVPQRTAYYYGRTMSDWTPYRSLADATPIARYADNLISGLGHSAVLEPLDKYPLAETFLAAQRSPSVLIVDPWAARIAEISDKLRIIDRDPTHVVIPWNIDDSETIREESRLLVDLRTALRNSLSLKGSTSRVPTLDHFRYALAKAVNGAVAKHFKTAKAYPPDEPPTMDRPPALEGPEA